MYTMIIKHNFHKLLNKRNLPTISLGFNDQLKRIENIYNSKFQSFFKKQTYHYTSYGLTSCEEKWHAKSINKLQYKFKAFLEISTIIKNNYSSQNQYFKIENNPLISRSQYHKFKRQLFKMCDTYTLNFNTYLNKTTKPKNIRYKYSHWQRQKIREFCFSMLHNGYFYDYTSIWLEIRKGEKLSKHGDFSKLNRKTFMKIIETDERYTKHAVTPYKPKHPMRTKIKEIGNVQMDLKILGFKETSTNEKINVFNMIDTSTRFVFSRVLNSGDYSEVLEALNMGTRYFNDNGIIIKTMQTDNAMMFKKTNFVKSNQYSMWCKNNNIIQRTIPLGQPQCNGCVERFHLTIDKELHHKLIMCKTLDDLQSVFTQYMHYYNYQRWHHYAELKKNPVVDRHLKPFEAIERFACYNSIGG